MKLMLLYSKQTLVEISTKTPVLIITLVMATLIVMGMWIGPMQKNLKRIMINAHSKIHALLVLKDLTVYISKSLGLPSND